MRIYFIIILMLIAGCDNDKKTSPTTETVVACSPYYIADFNGIVHADRLKNGYSADMSALCSGFQTRYKNVTRCGAYPENGGSLEIIKASTVEYLCGRNERLAATTRNTQPSLLQFSDSGEVTLKLMVLNADAFSNQKVFSKGKSYPLSALKSTAAYCQFSSSAPLQNNDLIQVTDIEDITKDKVRSINYSGDVYRERITVSISCVRVPAKESPKDALKTHFNKTVTVD